MVANKKSAYWKVVNKFISQTVGVAKDQELDIYWDTAVLSCEGNRMCFNLYVTKGEAGYILALSMDGVNGRTMRINKVIMHDQPEVHAFALEMFTDDIELWVMRELGLGE